MLTKSKSNRSLLKGKDVSLQHLATLNTFLDTQLNQTQYINKEIKNQITLAQKNDLLVDKTFYKINGDGQSLIRRYQEEKERNEKLEFLVSHIEKEIFSAKMDKANDLKNKIQTDKLAELTNLLTQREKDLEKICEKTNTTSYELTKKMDSIRALRSERAIFSDLFDKLERELCNLEHCYKVLVIQNKIEDRQCEEKIEEFNHCQLAANKKLEKAMSKARQKEKNYIDHKQSNDTPKKKTWFANIPSDQGTRANNLSQSEFSKEKEMKDRLQNRSIKYENDMLQLERQKIVKSVLNELGISSIKQIPEDFHSLQEENQILLQKNQQIYQDIQALQIKLQGLNRKRQAQDNHYLKKDIFLAKKQSLNNCIQDIKKKNFELSEFSRNCKLIYQRIKENNNSEDQSPELLNEEEQTIYYMGQIQQYMQKSYIGKENCQQKPKKPKQLSKRLTSLLITNHNDRNIMSIYQEKDLLDFAKKNLHKLEHQDRRQSLVKE